jgi:hypothetical protein
MLQTGGNSFTILSTLIAFLLRIIRVVIGFGATSAADVSFLILKILIVICRDTGACLIRLDQGVLVPSYISLLYPLFWLSRLSNTQHILPDNLPHTNTAISIW